MYKFSTDIVIGCARGDLAAYLIGGTAAVLTVQNSRPIIISSRPVVKLVHFPTGPYVVVSSPPRSCFMFRNGHYLVSDAIYFIQWNRLTSCHGCACRFWC